VTIVRTGFLGDAVCAIPAFRLLRSHFPDARLTLLSDRASPQSTQARDVVGSLNIFDAIVEYGFGGRGVLRDLVAFTRAERPDIVVILTQRNEPRGQSWKRRLFFRLLGVRTILSLAPIRKPSVVINEPTRLVHGLNRLRIGGAKPDYGIVVDDDAAAGVRTELSRVGIDAARPYIVFCGGGKAPTQRWPLARYAAVLTALHEEAGLPVIGIGSPGELDEYRTAIVPLFPGFRALTMPLSFRALAELLRQATLYFGNDTGPMHVAAAVGCPTAVVMSGRNTLGAWDPDSHPSLVIRHDVPCQGCFLVDCTRFEHRCMTEISVASVTARVRSFLQRLPKRVQLDRPVGAR
jgi:ADP-heptose:LPS heptosyltransferase